MAAPTPPGARLTAALAVVVAVILAVVTPTGPWQPASVILGWSTVVLVGLGVAVGLAGPLAAGAVLTVVRVGVHGLAGDRVPGLVITSILLVVMVELALTSFETRVIPIHLPTAMGRLAVIAVVAGLVVVAVSGLAVDGGAAGAGGSLVALAAALAVGVVVYWLTRRASREDESHGAMA